MLNHPVLKLRYPHLQKSVYNSCWDRIFSTSIRPRYSPGFPAFVHQALQKQEFRKTCKNNVAKLPGFTKKSMETIRISGPRIALPPVDKTGIDYWVVRSRKTLIWGLLVPRYHQCQLPIWQTTFRKTLCSGLHQKIASPLPMSAERKSGRIFIMLINPFGGKAGRFYIMNDYAVPVVPVTDTTGPILERGIHKLCPSQSFS